MTKQKATNVTWHDGEVAKLFSDAGTISLSSFISPYKADRDEVRNLHEQANLAFIEVFVACSLAVAEERDPKGLYKKARAGRIALRDPNVDGNPVMAIMDIDAIDKISSEQMTEMTQEVYGTTDVAHPGVAVFRNLGNFCISGAIQVLGLSYFATDFEGTFKTV